MHDEDQEYRFTRTCFPTLRSVGDDGASEVSVFRVLFSINLSKCAFNSSLAHNVRPSANLADDEFLQVSKRFVLKGLKS